MMENEVALEPGTVYVVSTPIGNLEDFTKRAIETLSAVSSIAAEDTRRTRILLNRYEIQTPLSSYNSYNKFKKGALFVDRLKKGESIALVSDAGTPAISDPGFLLTRACIQNNIEVDCLPGATAFVPALVNSGFPNDRFVFEGFLPVKKGRQTRLLELAEETRTMIFYESPHKLLKTLAHFAEYFGENRLVSVSRELTKLFEETQRGTVTEVLAYYTSKPPKGEIVIVVAGKK